MIAVSNSTPLIALSKINQLNLLREYFGEVYIPEEVYDEVVRRGGDLAGASEVASCSWIKVQQVKNRMATSQEGKLELKRAMDDLRAVGFRLSDREYERILAILDKNIG